MAPITLALAQSVKSTPPHVIEQNVMWWLRAMDVAKDSPSNEDFYVLIAEHPCFCNKLEDQDETCASCHAQVLVERRIFAQRKN